MTVTAQQSRAARAVLDWTQTQLSETAGVARATVAEFEAGKRTPIGNNLAAIRSALEAAGIVFLADGELVSGGPGVRLKGVTSEGS